MLQQSTMLTTSINTTIITIPLYSHNTGKPVLAGTPLRIGGAYWSSFTIRMRLLMAMRAFGLGKHGIVLLNSVTWTVSMPPSPLC